jgi:hypothetical protein
MTGSGIEVVMCWLGCSPEDVRRGKGRRRGQRTASSLGAGINWFGIDAAGPIGVTRPYRHKIWALQMRQKQSTS